MAGEWETIVPAKTDDWETVVPAAKKAKYQASEDTQYSAEGVPLVSDIPEGEAPALAQKTADIMTDVAGAPVRAAASIAKPIAGISEMLGYGAPAKAITALDTGIKSQTGPISTAASIAGDVAGFGAAGKAAQMGLGALKQVPKIADISQAISQVAPKFLTTPGVASTVAKGVGIGAGTGLLEPVGKAAGEEGFVEEKAKQAGMGAALGPAAQAIGYGASRVLSPQLQRLKDLAAQGIDVNAFLKKSTLGQTLGGATQTAENVIKSLPFSGMKPIAQAGEENLQNLAYQKAQQMAKAARGERGTVADELTNVVRQEKFDLGQTQKAQAQKLDTDLAASAEAIAAKHTDQFSLPLINNVLKPLGKELPKGVMGNAAINEAAKEVSAGFERGLDEMKRVPIDKKAILSLVETKSPKLGDYAGEFEAEANRLVDLMGRKTYIPSREWQAEYQALNDASYKARLSSDIKERNYGQALRDLRDVWFKNVETAPNAKTYLAANEAHSALQPVQKAASYVSAVAERGGQFSPREFLTATKADTTEKQFARGLGKNQEAAVKAYQDQLNELKQIKQQHKLSKEQLKQQHDLERKVLAEKHTGLGRTAAEQKADINQAQQLAQRNLNQATGDIVKEGRPGYFMNRLGYMLAAAPFLTNIFHGLQAGAPAAAITGGLSNSVLPAAGLAVAPGLTARMLYSNPKMQEILKNLATKRSPEMQAAGQELRGQLGTTVPAAGVGALYQGNNVTVEGTPEGYATGGLIHLAPGGKVTQSAQYGILDMNSPNPLSLYRADPTGKHGGKDRMETLPTKVDKTMLQDYIKAMRAGEEFGVPQLSPTELAKMALVEGRADFGFNNLNKNNKAAVKTAGTLVDYGHPDTAAGFAGALIDKTQAAEHYNLPFLHVWNGRGVTQQKQTGADYANKYAGLDYAIEHPKNASLMQAINEAYQYQTPKPNPSPFESIDPMGNQNGLGYLR